MRGEVLQFPHFGDGLEVGFCFREEMAEVGWVERSVEAEERVVYFLGGEKGAF